MDKFIIAICVTIVFMSSVNGLPLRQVNRRQADPDYSEYLSNATRVLKDGLDILGRIATHSTIIPEAALGNVLSICPVLDVVSEYESIYSQSDDSSNGPNAVTTVVEDIRNRTCNWLSQASGTGSMLSSDCSSAELRLLCLQMNLYIATYNAMNSLSATSDNSYEKWLKTHFDSNASNCLLSSDNNTIRADVPVADCLQ